MNWIVLKLFRMGGNFYWKIFGGIALWLLWLVLATAFALTIVGFPFALQLYRISWVVFKPFGKQVVIIPDRFFWSVMWFFSFGMIFGLVCVSAWIATSVALVGLPLFYQWYKVTKLAFFPFCAKFA